jgi:hypothetical protein
MGEHVFSVRFSQPQKAELFAKAPLWEAKSARRPDGSYVLPTMASKKPVRLLRSASLAVRAR